MKGDMINLQVICSKKLKDFLNKNVHFLLERTNSRKIDFVDGKLAGKAIDFSIKEEKISASFS
jgi:hypothetical protein